uniref:RRM domain-containing protein n=2 Tax=Aplanochytrium stocchinoi TaxID=215587 RepID=A0A7S3PEB0_9STRA|mmetsp:Transcript_7080/g.9262  ORF Transcript_7080/g.9262 Transcript_7080/m.9262 type:complete len:112 (+) Transcript_7080:141-476(+)
MGDGMVRPSRILVLLNMVKKEELLDDTEYEDIMADIRGESELHGKVLSISIPRPNKNDPDAIVPGLEKVYIEFASELDAIQARSKLEGRNFGDQTVGCEFLDEEKYKAREF